MSLLAEKISDSELEVMKVLWEAGDALPVTEIRTALCERRGWEATTVKTLVGRLVAKGALAQEKRKVFYYRPRRIWWTGSSRAAPAALWPRSSNPRA